MAKTSCRKSRYVQLLRTAFRKPAFLAFAAVVGVAVLFLTLFQLRSNNESEDDEDGLLPPPAIIPSASLKDAERCLLISPGGPEGYSLRDLLSSWPADKPKAFIYATIGRTSAEEIGDLLRNVYSYFNKRFDYPFIIFTESQEITNAVKRYILVRWLNATSSGDDNTNGISKHGRMGQVFAYVVDSLRVAPAHMLNRHGDDLNDLMGTAFRSIMKSGCFATGELTFWLACRFHSKGIMTLPFVRGFEYMWRLDKESRLCEEISFDLFRLMKDGRYWLGYIVEDTWNWCAQQLTEAVHKFVGLNGITPAQGNESIRDARMHNVYSNFEVVRVQFFLSEYYRRYINYIDLDGGIFYYRWCDGPIKTQAYRLFMPKTKMRQFKANEVFYRYKSLDRCRKSTGEAVGGGIL